MIDITSPIIQALEEWGDNAYFAGIIDGEGSVIITYRISEDGQYHWMAQICVVSTHLPMLEWVEAKYGGSIYSRKSQGNQKSCWFWRTSNKEDILRVVDKVSPFLIIKQKQVLLIKEYYGGMRRYKRRLGKEENERRMDICNAMRAANQRGVCNEPPFESN